MAHHGQGDLIDNFITELQPYLALIDQAVEELARPVPASDIIDQAVESLEIIRDASGVLGFMGLVLLTSNLDDAIEALLDSVTQDRDALLERTRAMAAGIHRYMDALSRGHDTDELVQSVLAPFDADASPPPAPAPAPAPVVPQAIPEIVAADPELREIFEEEAAELIASYTRGALMLVARPDQPALLTSLRRDAHTLKGAANMTGFPMIGTVGGAVELLLDAHIEGNVPVQRETLGIVLSARKLLAGMLTNLDNLGPFTKQAELVTDRSLALYRQIAPPLPLVEAPVEVSTSEAAERVVVTPEPVDIVSDEPGDIVINEVPATVEMPERQTEAPVETAEPQPDDMVTVWDALYEAPAPEEVDDQPEQPATNDAPIDVLMEDTTPEPVIDTIVEPVADEQPLPAVETTVAEATPDQPDPLPAADDEPELDVYEMAAEIAQLARMRPTLQPQNAMFFPTDASELSNDIDALSAQIIDTGDDIPILSGTTVEVPPTEEPATEPEPLAALLGMAQDSETLGYALLDLAFEGEQPTLPDAAPATAADERMQQELRETFAVEAADYADSLTLSAMALERDADSTDALRELTRVLHTLKGSAAAAGYDDIGARCHQIEDDLATGADITRAFTDSILDLASQIERLTSGNVRIDPRSDADPVIAQPVGDLRVELRRLDGLLNLVGELVINRATLDQRLQRLSGSLDELAHMTDRLRRSGQTLERVAGDVSLFGPVQTPNDDRIIPFNGHSHDLRREFDVLEMDRYTDLDVLARELSEVASDIGTITGEVRNLRGDFETVSTHQRRLTNDIQDELMSVRMVPLATLSPLLHRVVRRVAQECGKDVNLIIEGSEIAFDKALVDALGDALLHLLRNAVDHGIEPAITRRAAGKPEAGRILVRAWQDRGNAVVEVIDDGCGVDTARLIERARTFGFVSSDTVSEAEALQLMFLPGFSSRDSASSISGRGVGLDAVWTAVERVKGRVTVDTKPGTGTIFQLRLPVMLAVAQAFLVEAGSRRYAVPLADVDFVADRRQASLSRVGNGALVEINDAVIPVIDLANRLAGATDRLDDETGWLLVTRAGGEPRALRVDALHGQQEIVVKPLGRYLSGAPGVTGATILGDGEIALILDVTDITGTRAQAKPLAEPLPLDSGRTGTGTALVVDDSLSVRRVLARTLERHGWHVVQAHDGVEALELLHSGGVDVVVTDIEMPRMDGFELINSIRRGGWQSLPVIVLTSRSSSKHRDKAMELGANAYIVKPFQEEELVQALARETTAIRVA